MALHCKTVPPSNDGASRSGSGGGSGTGKTELAAAAIAAFCFPGLLVSVPMSFSIRFTIAPLWLQQHEKTKEK